MKASRSSAAGLVVGERRPEAGDVVGGGAARRLADEADLDQQPHRLELAVALGLGEHLPDAGQEGRDQAGGGRHRHAGRRAVADLDQAGALQRDQRLANRRAADAEGRLQVALGRQPVAGLERAVEDLLLEVVGHLLEELLALDQLRLHPPTFHTIILDNSMLPATLAETRRVGKPVVKQGRRGEDDA